jgi:hypothetical protein
MFPGGKEGFRNQKKVVAALALTSSHQAEITVESLVPQGNAAV